MAYTKNLQQGIFKPTQPQKYVGNPRAIVYRSSWELRFMKQCDTNSNVLEWGYEEVVIPYRSPIDNKMHRYFVDFIIRVRTKDGKVQTHLVEIKPKKFVEQPKPQKRKTKKFLNEVMEWGINQAKWTAAQRLAEKKGWSFSLMTEHDLGIAS